MFVIGLWDMGMKLVKIVNGVLGGAFIFIVGAICPIKAAELVDLDRERNHPLGEILEDQAGDQIYFSLGNGRAIKFSADRRARKGPLLVGHLLLRRDGHGLRPRLVKRRNLKW